MPDIRFATQAYDRDVGSFPELRLVNMYPEESPTAERQVAIVSRKGLYPYLTRGSGPIRGLFFENGVVGGSIFAVSGSTLYRDGTSLGSLSGAAINKVSWAGATNEILVGFAVTGIHSYNGTNLASVALPGQAVVGLAFVSRLFILFDNTGRFYWSAIEDGRTFDALDYANAEMNADGGRGALAIRGNLYLFGSMSTEVWRPVGDPNLPFARINVHGVGLIDYHCASVVDNAAYIIGSDGICYRLEDVPVRVSTHAIEEKIAAQTVTYPSTGLNTFAFSHEGHTFFCIQCDDWTFGYDVATQQWCEFQRDGGALDVVAAMYGKTAIFGDGTTGDIYVMQDYVDTDASLPIDRTFTGYFPVSGGEVHADNISLVANTGSTTVSVGSGSDPVVQIRASRDAGKTWTAYRSIAMGAIQKFRTRVFSRRWGTFDAPGGMFEVKYTEPTDFRVSAFKINEHGGGRSRT